MSVFPLNIATKEDTPERLLALSSVPEKNKILAEDTNEIVAALKELHARGLYLQDNNGRSWYVRKGDGNVNVAAFEEWDKIEGFVDEAKTEWIEGIIVGEGFTGVESLANKAIFFKTGGKIRII